MSAFAVLMLATPVEGSIVRALTLGELVEQADRIFVGEVVLSESFERSNGTLGTWHRIVIEERLRGALDEDEVIVETLGGQIGDLAMRVEGEPSFSIGERVLVFARGGGPYHAARPIGMGQGVMRVRWKRGVQMVRQTRQGMLLVRRNAVGHLVESRGALPEEEELDAFLAKLRRVLEAQSRHSHD